MQAIFIAHLTIVLSPRAPVALEGAGERVRKSRAVERLLEPLTTDRHGWTQMVWTRLRPGPVRLEVTV